MYGHNLKELPCQSHRTLNFPFTTRKIPDPTITGREARPVIAIDSALKNEENVRKEADKVLTDNLANEVADREAADTALGGRIDTEKADSPAPAFSNESTNY